MPKEIRNLRPEFSLIATDAMVEESDFWSWGEEEGGTEWVMHEEQADGPTEPLNLLERTAAFGEAIIRFAKQIPRGREHPKSGLMREERFVDSEFDLRSSFEFRPSVFGFLP